MSTFTHKDAEGQIMALLANRGYEYVARVVGASNFTTEVYREVFTVRLPDVREYVERHGTSLEDYAAAHWLNFERRDGRWIVGEYFPPEKSPGFWRDTEFDTEAEAREFLLKKILNTAHVGISF